MSELNKTFGDLVDEIGLSTVFEGTDADQVTQEAILDWFFNYELCDDNDSTFLRYFRRKIKNIYPLYEARLRVSTAKGTMDPFIVDFMERVRTDTKTTSGTVNGTESDTNGSTRSIHKVTDNQDVRTPQLTTIANGQSTGSNRQTTDGTVTEERDLASTEDSSATTEGKSRNFSVAYPEANLSGIPTDVDSYPASIDYVSGEADSLSKSETSGDVDRTDTGTVSTDTDTTVTGSESSTDSRTVRETGTDRRDFDGDETTTDTVNGTGSKTTATSTSGSETGEGSEIEQGRHESVADLLPRALAAISGSNDLMWLCHQLLPCFVYYKAV